MVLLLVLAGGVQLVMALGQSIVYVPDSGLYILYGHIINQRLDFDSISFIRTPGYPVLLAGVFRLLGPDSTMALKAIQHAFCLVTVGLVFMIGRRLHRNFWFAWLAGLVACGSFQLWGFASSVLTEPTYAMLQAAAVYCLLTQAQTGQARVFFLGMTLWGIATIIRPQGQMLCLLPAGLWFLQHFWPALLDRLRGPAQPSVAAATLGRGKAAAWLAVGLCLFSIWVAPWMTRNYLKFGAFNLGQLPGTNLYSRVVEYTPMVDEDSPAIKEIRDTFETWRQRRIAKGEVDDGTYSWRWTYHLSALAAVMDVHGQNMAQADKLLLRASLDCIKKHPRRYVENTLRSIWYNAIWYEPIYLYVSGLPPNQPRGWPNNFLMDVNPMLEWFTRIQDYAGLYLVGQEPPNYFTGLYEKLTRYYFYLTAFEKPRDRILALQVLGLLVLLWRAVLGPRRMESLLFALVLAYGILLPILIIPAMARMRVPLDPLLALAYAYGFFGLIDGAGWLGRRAKSLLRPGQAR